MTNNLKTSRKQAKMAIWDLASRAKVSPSTISAIERYGYEPRDSTKEKIAKALGSDVATVFSSTHAALN